MKFRDKIYFIILGIAAQVLFCGDVRARQVQQSDSSTGHEIVAPWSHDIRLVSFDPWVVEGEVLGAVAGYVYDDVTTERPADYWELYDKEGNLLAVSWFDRFGIRRIAVDRGILEGEDKLEENFVVVLDGNLL